MVLITDSRKISASSCLSDEDGCKGFHCSGGADERATTTAADGVAAGSQGATSGRAARGIQQRGAGRADATEVQTARRRRANPNRKKGAAGAPRRTHKREDGIPRAPLGVVFAGLAGAKTIRPAPDPCGMFLAKCRLPTGLAYGLRGLCAVLTKKSHRIYNLQSHSAPPTRDAVALFPYAGAVCTLFGGPINAHRRAHVPPVHFLFFSFLFFSFLRSYPNKNQADPARARRSGQLSETSLRLCSPFLCALPGGRRHPPPRALPPARQPRRRPWSCPSSCGAPGAACRCRGSPPLMLPTTRASSTTTRRNRACSARASDYLAASPP